MKTNTITGLHFAHDRYSQNTFYHAYLRLYRLAKVDIARAIGNAAIHGCPPSYGVAESLKELRETGAPTSHYYEEVRDDELCLVWQANTADQETWKTDAADVGTWYAPHFDRYKPTNFSEQLIRKMRKRLQEARIGWSDASPRQIIDALPGRYIWIHALRPLGAWREETEDEMRESDRNWSLDRAYPMTTPKKDAAVA